jgi:ferredoxin-NADP reductase
MTSVAWFMANLGTVLGAGICALVFAQLAIQFLRATEEMLYQRNLHRLRLDEIAQRVQQIRQQHLSHRHSTGHWDGWRKFEVQQKVIESAGCCSIYLVPHDGRPLPSFLPGQFLTFAVKFPGEARPVVRCYSLSDAPGKGYYRCTIKRVDAPDDEPQAPAGRVSSYFFDELAAGDIVDVRAPSGAFFLDIQRHRPVVLIAGGIGVTPLLSMLYAVVDGAPHREVHFFYGVQNSRYHTFREAIAALCERSVHVHLHTCYSRPTPTDVREVDYHHEGRITPELLRRSLPSNNFDFFVCGPPAFMQSILDGLRGWNVPEDSIFTETFGPACVSPRRHAATQATSAQVRFDRSGKTADWNPHFATLLDLAEAQGIPIDSGCRTGNCGTCLTAIKAGCIEYVDSPATAPPDGSCLPCICAPASDLVLDA